MNLDEPTPSTYIKLLASLITVSLNVTFLNSILVWLDLVKY